MKPGTTKMAVTGEQFLQANEATPYDEVLQRSGVFQALELERLYRQQQLPSDVVPASVLVIIFLIGYVTFLPSDYRLFGMTAPFWALLAVRAAMILTSLITLFLLKRSSALPRIDRALLLWAILTAAAPIYIAFTRPSNYTGQFMINVLIIFTFYSVLPLPVMRQIIPALLLSLGNLFLVVRQYPSIEALTLTVVAAGSFFANVLGIVVSRELNVWKRRQFVALRQESQLRLALEQALAEIKTLRGIIPICAHCKRIRDDTGYWQQVEVYVSDHTHADFSHGICPDCIQTMLARHMKR